MKNLIKIYCTVTLIIFGIGVFGQNNLERSVVDFMSEYEKYSSFTLDGMAWENSYVKEFEDLFQASSKLILFNDFNRDPEQAYYDLKEYTYYIKKRFDKGINVSIYINEIGEKYNQGNDSFVDVIAKKELFGLDASGRLFKNEVELHFKLRVIGSGSSSTFKIVDITAKGYSIGLSGFYVGLNIKPAMNSLVSSDFLNENNDYGIWNEKMKLAFDFGLEFNHYFKNLSFLGWGARINYAVYQSNIELSSLVQQNLSDQTDIDGDSFVLLADANSLTEDIKYSFLDIPVFLKLRIQMNNSSFLNHIYVNLGPVFSFGLSQNISTSGNYTYRGYYPQYNVVLYDIPEYGYYTDVPQNFETESNLKSFILSALAEIGFNIPLQADKWNLNIAFAYQKGLSELSAANQEYVLTNRYEQINALIDSRNQVKTESIGINIGIFYKLSK